MTKYKIEMTLEFETETVLPEMDVKGDAAVLEQIFEILPNVEDINESATIGTFVLKQA